MHRSDISPSALEWFAYVLKTAFKGDLGDLRRCCLLVVTLLGVVASLGAVSGTPHFENYCSALKFFSGQSYTAMNCSEFVCGAHNLQTGTIHHCTAKQLWDGCNGALHQVPLMQPGDILVFHSTHVVAYLGHGQYIDSTPEHGVEVQNHLNDRDLWTSGPVRIMRWEK